MIKRIALTAAALTAAAGIFTAGLATVQAGPAVCTFDGGGRIAAGNAARTTDGHVWECTEDGRLIRIR